MAEKVGPEKGLYKLNCSYIYLLMYPNSTKPVDGVPIGRPTIVEYDGNSRKIKNKVFMHVKTKNRPITSGWIDSAWLDKVEE